MKTILAAVDTSKVSEVVVAEAANLARAAKGRVILVTVVQPPVITSDYGPVMDNLADVVAAGEQAAKMHLAKLQQRLETDGVSNQTVQLNGAPVANILAQAKEYSADYIVLGSHGHTAFYELLVGSTTHGVLLRAECPVVILPPQDKNVRKTRG